MLATLGFRLADRIVRGLSLERSRSLARRLAGLAFHLRVPARRRTRDNLSRLIGGADRRRLERCTREAFELFALGFVDFLRLDRLAPDQIGREVEVRGGPHLDEARRSGRGVLLLSVHSGSWEWGAAFLSSLGPRVHVAARAQARGSLERWFAERRARHGVSRLAGEPLWPDAARALRRREWVAIMGDRVPPGERDSVCAWVAALARRTGAVILPAVMLRRPGGGYAACFEAPLDPQECLSGGFRERVLPHFASEPGQWLAFDPLPGSLA